MLRAASILILAIFMLTGCGKLPRPFERDAVGAPNQLATNIFFEGVEVLPITGSTPPMGLLLAQSIVKHLEKDFEIPAATEGLDRSRFVLTGNVVTNDGSTAARTLYSIGWQLSVRGEGPLSTFVQDVPASRIEWDYGSPPILNQVGISVSTRVAKLILGGRFNSTGQDRFLGRNGVLIGDVTGAPGDGNAALKRSMAVALGGGGLKIARNPEEAVFTVTAHVDMGLPEKGAQAVKVLWLVKDVDGNEVGRAEQANAVPAGSLDGRWGRTAAFVAAAAMDGIIIVIERNDPSKLRVPDLGSGSRKRYEVPKIPKPNLKRVPGRAPPPPN